MQKKPPLRRHITELSLSAFVLLVLLWFTYGIFAWAPYAGFYSNPTDGEILQVFVEADPAALKEGDTLVRVGTVSWESYYEDGRLAFFEGAGTGDIVEVVVERDGAELSIPWKIPGFNREEFIARFVNIWWLAYVFWFFGSATQLLMRPKETRWQLLIAANYLTGLWLIFGCLSSTHLWESSTLLHTVSWLILPVYLHLHWIFPKPFRPMPKFAGVLFYGASLLLAAAELVQILPRSLYALGFLCALAGSVILQGIHFLRRPDQRREVGFLAASILVVLTPLVSLSVSGLSGVFPQVAPLTFLALPFMPAAYFYVIYRRQMGGLELRANRFISIYAFLILLCSILFLLIGPATLLPISHEATIFLAVVISSAAAFVSILLFPAFQTFLEQRFLGIKLPYQNLQEAYSALITTSASIPKLLHLLDQEVFPSLLVRQFAFMQVVNGDPKVLSTKNIAAERLPGRKDIDGLAARSGKYLPDASPGHDSSCSWVRLILPLKIGEDLIGLWLLGRRDPDDLYSQAEIPVLQALANQTAIALSNILHTEQLRKMYQLDIERYEKERLRLALDLHDSILNQLAVLRTNLDDAQLSPKFHGAYDELTRRLREIVSDLRPPMLMYGLKPAIEELADNLMQRSGDKIRITVDVGANAERYPQNIEQHLYRILQEACENALRHAKAGVIHISGRLDPGRIDLTVEDDGAGFDVGERLELGSLLAKNHFGLAGIVERAMLIGAEVEINSFPRGGTQIRVALDTNLHNEGVAETPVSN